MECKVMRRKLKKLSASGFAVGSLFPFFCEVSFSLCGEKFFFARLRLLAADRAGQERRPPCCL